MRELKGLANYDTQNNFGNKNFETSRNSKEMKNNESQMGINESPEIDVEAEEVEFIEFKKGIKAEQTQDSSSQKISSFKSHKGDIQNLEENQDLKPMQSLVQSHESPQRKENPWEVLERRERLIAHKPEWKKGISSHSKENKLGRNPRKSPDDSLFLEKRAKESQPFYFSQKEERKEKLFESNRVFIKRKRVNSEGELSDSSSILCEEEPNPELYPEPIDEESVEECLNESDLESGSEEIGMPGRFEREKRKDDLEIIEDYDEIEVLKRLKSFTQNKLIRKGLQENKSQDLDQKSRKEGSIFKANHSKREKSINLDQKDPSFYKRKSIPQRRGTSFIEMERSQRQKSFSQNESSFSHERKDSNSHKKETRFSSFVIDEDIVKTNPQTKPYQEESPVMIEEPKETILPKEKTKEKEQHHSPTHSEADEKPKNFETKTASGAIDMPGVPSLDPEERKNAPSLIDFIREAEAKELESKKEKHDDQDFYIISSGEEELLEQDSLDIDYQRLMNDKNAFYSFVSSYGFYLPDINSRIITSSFLMDVLDEKTFCPKKEDIRIMRTWKPVGKKELRDEILKAKPETRLDEYRQADKFWLKAVLSTVKPDHEFFSNEFIKENYKTEGLIHKKFRSWKSMAELFPYPIKMFDRIEGRRIPKVQRKMQDKLVYIQRILRELMGEIHEIACEFSTFRVVKL